MRDYYEELWASLPAGQAAPDVALRSRFAEANIERGDAVLDLGCGDGALSGVLGRGGAQVTGVDVAEAALARARTRHPELAFRRTRESGPLPFEDNVFDVVWASEVIEHVADTARFLSEARRVLRPRGRLLLTTPNHGRLRLLASGIERLAPPLGDHLHLYDAGGLRRTLEEFGFGELEVRAAGGPPGLRRVLIARGVR